MRKIVEPRVTECAGGFTFACSGCGSIRVVSYRANALVAIRRGTCSSCAEDYRKVRERDKDAALGVYQNGAGKWCSTCAGCGTEQAYTRKDHARSSARAGWSCKACANFARGVNRQARVDGFRSVDFDSFAKHAASRGRAFELRIEDLIRMWRDQQGLCALSGVALDKHPRTWSLDRIDNAEGYVKDNVHLVHKRVNMARGTLRVDDFVSMCRAVSYFNSVHGGASDEGSRTQWLS